MARELPSAGDRLKCALDRVLSPDRRSARRDGQPRGAVIANVDDARAQID